jgi:hypothetical protein
MSSSRPTMFIGSSSEGLKIAESIQLNLDHVCEAKVWSQGVFGLTQGTLESLVAQLHDFDFATLVLTPDDITISRGEEVASARDNVFIELGLFIGALGRERTFIVYERNKVKLPSDLAGVTLADYEMHTDGNLQATLGAATTKIKNSIEKQGKHVKKISGQINEYTQFQIIHDLMDKTPEQFIIWMYENDKSLIRQFNYPNFGIKYEYASIYAGGQGYFSIDELCKKLPDAGLLKIDLRDQVTLTEHGKNYAQWLLDNGHKADYFHSDIGHWGEHPTDGKSFWPSKNHTSSDAKYEKCES